MAYFDTTSPAGVLSREITATRNVLGAIGAAFTRVFYAIGENSTGAIRARKVHELKAKSDAELAAMNLRRDDIVRAVFIDRYYF